MTPSLVQLPEIVLNNENALLVAIIKKFYKLYRVIRRNLLNKNTNTTYNIPALLIFIAQRNN